MQCSSAPFSKLLDTMCKNVLLGYRSLDVLGDSCEWVTDNTIQILLSTPHGGLFRDKN